MPTGTPQPWHFVSAPLGVDLSVYVTGDPDWARPVRSRFMEDPGGGPPTIISRGGPLARRRIVVQMFLPHGPDLASQLAAVRAAYTARGPYTLTTHIESLTVVFDPAAGGLRELDRSTEFLLTVGLAEV